MKALIAIDSSEQARTLTSIVQSFSTVERIVLVHAIEIPQVAYPGTGMSVGHTFSQRAEQALRQAGTRLFEECEVTLPGSLVSTTRIMETGSPAEVILAVAEQQHVDLILVGSRSLGIIREYTLGSVSHRIIAHATCSTLVAKNKRVVLKNILAPLADQTDAERLISFLRTHPFQETIRLTLLHVIPFAQPTLPVSTLIPDACVKDLFRGGEDFTDAVASTLTSMGYATSTIVKPGAPSMVIHDEARRLQADLILMAKQQRSALSRFFMGSVSHAIIHHSTASVLLIH